MKEEVIRTEFLAFHLSSISDSFVCVCVCVYGYMYVYLYVSSNRSVELRIFYCQGAGRNLWFPNLPMSFSEILSS